MMKKNWPKIILIIKEKEANRDAVLYSLEHGKTIKNMAQNRSHSQGEGTIWLENMGGIFNRHGHVKATRAGSKHLVRPMSSNAGILTSADPNLA